MKSFSTAIAFALACIATSALAGEQNSPWYGSVSGDLGFPSKTSASGTTNGDVNYNLGGGGNAAIGYEPGALNSSVGDVRLEVEAGYHVLGIKDITAGGVSTKLDNKVKLATLMGNVYYDIHTNTLITPYIGGGLGYANINFDQSNSLGVTQSSDNQMAYQFMTGISFSPKSMPTTDWSLGYRYMGVNSPKFGAEKLDSLHISNIEVGFRYHF